MGRAGWVQGRLLFRRNFGGLSRWFNYPFTVLNADETIKWTEPDGKNSQLMDSFDRSLKLAFEMQNAGRSPEAEALCRVLMGIRPKDAQLLFLLGMILHKGGRDEEAVEWLLLATQYQPQSARIFSGLGCVYQKLEDHPRAAAAFETALKLEPQSAATEYNLGNTSYKLGQVGKAEALFRNAVEKDPRDSACWNNLGKCLKELNRLDESIEAYNRALEIAPGYALATYGRAISLLTAGRYPEGFRDYEWRWHLVTPRQFSQPEWNGNPVPGRTLFLHAEQGFGDAMQMVRFIPAARERVGRVILECRPGLEKLFQYSNCADMVVPYGMEIPPFDFRLSLISLPRVLGVTLDTIPNRTPYLRAPALTSREPDTPSSQLPAPSLRVGLAWAGNSEHHQDAARSLRLEQLAPVLQVPGVAFYNLQRPIPAGDQSCLQTMSAIIHSNLKLADFLDTASVIAEMDLIISVDTAVAHLAGALGKPVWILLQHSSDWRWLLDRPDSRWYPTARLFRQVVRNEWETPIVRAAKALKLKKESAVRSQ
jgi:Flp pilus assembly protein TadD